MTGAQKKKLQDEETEQDEETDTGLYRGVTTSDKHMNDRSTEEEIAG